jgi:hypothetical protein
MLLASHPPGGFGREETGTYRILLEKKRVPYSNEMTRDLWKAYVTAP